MRKRKKEEQSTPSRSPHFNMDDFDTNRPYIGTGEAAQIMGISRWTLSRRRERWGLSSIRHCMLGAGNRWAYDMEDVIRSSYPSASDSEITTMMREYRQKFADARRRKISVGHYDSDFFSNLKNVLNSGGGHVVIYRKTNTQENPALVAELTLAQALGGRMGLEGALMDELVDGVYTVEIHDKDKEVLGQYEFSVGASPGTHTGTLGDVLRDANQAAFDGQRELMKLMVQYSMDNEYDDDEDDDDKDVYDAEYE